MTSEAPSTSGQQFYKDTVYVLSRDRAAAEIDVNNICSQTGEEFSFNFLRDRASVRRLPLISELEQHQPNRVGINFKNQQLVYEDLSGLPGLQRIDSESSSEFSEYVPGTGYGAQAENQTCADNVNKHHFDYGVIGQVPFKYAEVVEPSGSYYPHGMHFSEGSLSGKMKVLCSFGGRILPRPSDGKLRYAGGETRIISIRKNVIWEELMKKTSAICGQPHTIKYQLPGEDLDALVSVCSDEDLHHMIEEYQELERIEGSQRPRIFLVSSNEHESPCSSEGRAAQPIDVDCQYVAAINGTVDPSPRKSSSGQSLTSQTSQFGNTSDCSPTFQRDSPTTAYALENKDYGPSASNLVGRFSKPASQYLAALQIPSKSFNQSPPVSPGQHCAPKNSHVQAYVDPPCVDGNKSSNPFEMEIVPGDSPSYVESSYYLDGLRNYNNLPRGLPLMNYHLPNEFLAETGQDSKSHDRNFHQRSLSRDFLHSPSRGQNEINYERQMLEDRPFPEDPMGLWSEFNDTNFSHRKIMHALSDSQIQEHCERFNFNFLLSSSSAEREKPPSLGILNSPLHCEDRVFEKHKLPEYENRLTLVTNEDCKGNFELGQDMINWSDRNFSDPAQQPSEGNVESTSNDNCTELKNFPDLNYLPTICLSSQEVQNLKGEILVSPLLSFECSVDGMRKHPHGSQLDAAIPKFSNESQASDNAKPCALTETLSYQAVSGGYPALLPQGLDDQGSMGPSCVSIFLFAKMNSFKIDIIENNLQCFSLYQKSTTSTVPRMEAPLHNTGALNYPEHKDEIVELSRQSYDRVKSGDIIGVQLQSSDSHPDNNKLESLVIEDVTDCPPPGIPLSLEVVPRVEDEATDDSASPTYTEAEDGTLESECEVNIFPTGIEFIFGDNVFRHRLTSYPIFIGCER